MEKTDRMSHAEDVGKDVEDLHHRRGSVKGGDRALDYIGDDRVELTDEDASRIHRLSRRTY